MAPTPEQVSAGQAFYTKRSLAFYNAAILGFFSRVAWRCPAQRIVDHYNANISANHLDVGVGTGYFVDHCRFPSPAPRLGLMDLNPDCLEVAGRVVDRYRPEIYVANVLEPIPFEGPKFDSIGMNYLLHCLPGDIQAKRAAFANLQRLANPDATIFGATLLSGGVERNWFARKVMDRNNAHGIFSNRDDDLDGLRLVLSQQLTDSRAEALGCVAIFSGRVNPPQAS
jgi:Methyltransferase domain